MIGDRPRLPSHIVLVGLASLVATVVLGGCDGGGTEGDPAPSAERSASGPVATPSASLEDPDLYLVRSLSGRYVVQLKRADPESSYAAFHEWRVRIVDGDGAPIPPGPIAFDGGMPSHRHGFESRPLVTGQDPDGWYRVEGVRFHMAGPWVLRVGFRGAEGMDRAELDLEVPY
jgi:hypothetical protein